MSCKKLFIFNVFICFCCAVFAQEMPEEVIDALRNAPEDSIVGIGFAKTDNDWESISLAEERARIDIAKSISSSIRNIVRDNIVTYEGSPDEDIAYQENISEIYANAHIRASNIFSLTKTSDGTWWCVIKAYKSKSASITPQSVNNGSFLINSMFLSEVYNIRTISSVLEWINEYLKNCPEDSLYGIGVAKTENDADSAREALNRAKTSLGYSLHSEITYSARYYEKAYEIDVSSSSSHHEIKYVITSDYQFTDIPIKIIDLVKTSDGTFWGILSCQVDYLNASKLILQSLPILDAEDRMNKAFERAFSDELNTNDVEDRMNKAFERAFPDQLDTK
jgi:hypothetical protein